MKGNILLNSSFLLKTKTTFPFVLLLLFSIGEMACSEKREVKCIDVTATAYNNVYWQTKTGTPSIAAWGDTLKKGMKVIAVSRDLIDSGLVYNTAVYIPLLQDTFYVIDKMHYRWRKKIDIFMGKDIKKAREWGKQKVSIKFYAPKKEVVAKSK